MRTSPATSFLLSALLATFAHAAPPAAAPVLPADPDLEPEMKKLIVWLDEGTLQQQGIAQNALRMAPEEAIPVMKAMVEGKTLKPPTETLLKEIYESEIQARKHLRESDRALDDYPISLISCYDAVGDKSPAWDDAARAILKSYYDPADDGSIKIAERSRELVAKGCTDPHICWLQYAGDDNPGTVAERLKAVRAMLASKYPAACKFYSMNLLKKAMIQSTEAEQAEIRQLVLDAIPLVKVAREEKAPDGVRVSQLFTLIAVNTEPGVGKAGEAWESIAPKVRALLPGDYCPDWAEAETLHDAAWDLRGAGLANSVPEERWNTIHSYIWQSSIAAQRAIAIAKTHAKLSRLVLSNMRMNPSDPQSQLDEFRRCLSMNPDSTATVDALAWNTLKRWSGDENYDARLKRLAQACILSRNFKAHIPQYAYTLYLMSGWDSEAADRGKFWTSDYARRTIIYLFDTAMKLNPDQATINYATMAHCTIADIKLARKFLDMNPDFTPNPHLWPAQSWEAAKARVRNFIGEVHDIPVIRPDWMPE